MERTRTQVVVAVAAVAAICLAATPTMVDWNQIKNKPNITTFVSSDYNFTPQSPGVSISAGSHTVTIPCPRGINSFSVNKAKVYLSGGVGAAEAVLITGGTCTSGTLSSGTLSFTSANSHSGAWTIGPASFGLQEAINAASAVGGGVVTVPAGNFTLRATVRIVTGNITVEGSGIAPTPPTGGFGTYITRTGDFGDSIYAGAGAGNALFDINISGLRIEQLISYAVGPPPTTSNKPTSGAHIHVENCVNCSVHDNDLRYLPYGVELDTVGWTHVDNNTILSLWDYSDANAQIGIAGVYAHHSMNGGGLPTYLWVEHNTILGPGSAARTITVNGNNITGQVEPVGAKHGVLIESCELCWFRANSIEWQDSNGIAIIAAAPHSVTDALLVVDISDNYIDRNRTNGILFDMSNDPGTAFALGTKINNNWILGSEATINLIRFEGSATPPAFIRTAHETTITNNVLRFGLGSSIFMLAGGNTVITGNIIDTYDEMNSFPTNSLSCNGGTSVCTGDRLGNSGIYIGQAANAVTATGNKIGGNLYATSVAAGLVYTYNGISVGSPLTQQSTNAGALVLAPNGDGGVQVPSARSPAVAFDPAFFVVPGAQRIDGLPSAAVSGCGTLSATSTVAAGVITSATTGSCSPALTFTNVTASNGWACNISNRTTANLIRQTASSTTTATFNGTTVSGDVLSYACTAY